MRKRLLVLCCMITILGMTVTACGGKESAFTTEAAAVSTEEATVNEAAEDETNEESELASAVLEDGIYLADFDTDSGMFHVNEAYEGKGTLTVENGQMTIHVSLVSKNIVGLYLGKAADAPEDEENWIPYTEDEVTYKDGWTETVYGFDIPVSVLNEEFDLALIGKKGNWYDHKVSVSNPEPLEEQD